MSLLDDTYDSDILKYLADKFIQSCLDYCLSGETIYTYNGCMNEGDNDLILYEYSYFKTRMENVDGIWNSNLIRYKEFRWGPKDAETKTLNHKQPLGKPVMYQYNYVTPERILQTNKFYFF